MKRTLVGAAWLCVAASQLVAGSATAGQYDETVQASSGHQWFSWAREVKTINDSWDFTIFDGTVCSNVFTHEKVWVTPLPLHTTKRWWNLATGKVVSGSGSYVNSRIATFRSDGSFYGAWSTKGYVPENGTAFAQTFMYLPDFTVPNTEACLATLRYWI